MNPEETEAIRILADLAQGCDVDQDEVCMRILSIIEKIVNVAVCREERGR